MKITQTHPIRQFREIYDLSQEYLAGELGITQPTLANIELYKKYPGLETFLKMYLFAKKRYLVEMNITDFYPDDKVKRIEKLYKM